MDWEMTMALGATSENRQDSSASIAGDGAVRQVLVVDDSRGQRRLLSTQLSRWGYQVLEAASGQEALAVCATNSIDLILSDWMMPGMTGLDFCRAFRAQDHARYVYFILLTSKSEKGEVAHGLDVGADDFLTKPVHGPELRARIQAGERILQMERELQSKTKLIEATLQELQGLYDSIDRDLVQARKIQESLVPERHLQFGPSQVSLLLKPSGHVGGDLVGAFSPGPNRLGFYNIDVSGHGVTSALMTARLAGYLSGQYLDQNIALEQKFSRFFNFRPPEDVARILNERLLSDNGVEEYFTMVYGYIDFVSGHVKMVQAGHPHPAILRAGGQVEFIGSGGLPVGLIPGAMFESFEFILSKGDRILLYSDGFSEAVRKDGTMLEEAGLRKLLSDSRAARGPDFLDDVFWKLTEWRQGAPQDDDISAVLLEYEGPNQG